MLLGRSKLGDKVDWLGGWRRGEPGCREIALVGLGGFLSPQDPQQVLQV